MFGNKHKALSSYRQDVEGKPKASYHKLIADAIIQSNVGFLSLSDIYEAIQKQHPYYTRSVYRTYLLARRFGALKSLLSQKT